MTEFIQYAGSFATVWIGLWFFLSITLVFFYPLLRAKLLAWHPALSGNLLLVLMACPLLLGFSCALFLFLPLLESMLVSSHCHGVCANHVPLIDAPEVAVLGLTVVCLILTAFLVQIVRNLRAGQRLQKQLLPLARQEGEYLALEDNQPFVFTLGWWRSRIFVTDGLRKLCSDDELAAVLAHENAHSRRNDNLRILLARIFNSVLPRRFSKLLMDDFHLLIESACDFEASERFGELMVAETLLKIQKLSPSRISIGAEVITTAFTGSEIEQRISALVQGRYLSKSQQLGFQLSLFILLFASLALVQPLHHGVEFLFALH